jgi:hypothetical protein
MSPDRPSGTGAAEAPWSRRRSTSSGVGSPMPSSRADGSEVGPLAPESCPPASASPARFQAAVSTGARGTTSRLASSTVRPVSVQVTATVGAATLTTARHGAGIVDRCRASHTTCTPAAAP